MAKSVELRRHTASEGDVLSEEGVESAVEVASRLEGATVSVSREVEHWVPGFNA